MMDANTTANTQDVQSYGPLEKPRSVRATAADRDRTLPAPRLIDLKGAGAYLGCSYWTARGLVERGLIAPVRIPGTRKTLVDRADLDRLVEQWKERP